MPETACLLVHGFGGSPFEMRPLAEALENRGLAVSVPTLPGHGLTIEQWSRTGWKDWLAHAAQAYERLAGEHGKVFVAGFSMGGSLALALAQRYRPAGLVTIASPVYLYRFLPPEAADWRLPFTPILKTIRPIWTMPPKSPESRIIAPWEGYEGAVPMEALHSFMTGLRDVRRGLGKVTSPILSIHSPLDRQVPVGNVWEIARRVASKVRRTAIVDIQERLTSHHMITTHQETKEEVARLCVEFVAETASK